MPDPALDPLPTRHSLLAQLRDLSDQESWQEFFDTYWRLIYNSARKSGLTETEVQEVLQETLLAVSQKMPEFQVHPRPGSFRAWLRQLTRWRIADQFRKRTSGPRKSRSSSSGTEDRDNTGTAGRIADPAGIPLEAIWDQEWEAHLMSAALERVKSQVSAAQYQMFDLHALQKLSVRETAAALEVSVPAVYMATSRISRQVQKALKELREKLENQPGRPG